MANKPLQSIKFPGLSDTYTVPQIDSTLAVQGKAADAKAAGDKIAAVSAMTAEAFSTSTAYAVGDHVTYNGALYVFTTAHSAGAWNSSHVSAVTVEGELTNLKDDLTQAPGLTDAARAALLACFEHVAWVDENGRDYFDILEIELYSSTYPRLVATFSHGASTIYTDDSLDSLKQYVTVKYYENKDSSGVVVDSTRYEISGSLVEGTSTLQISYNNTRCSLIINNVVDFYNIYNWSYPGDIQAVENKGGVSNVDIDGYKSLGAHAYGNNIRMIAASQRGKLGYVHENEKVFYDFYPIPIPAQAKSVSVSIMPNTLIPGMAIWKLNGDRYQLIKDNGWGQVGENTVIFDSGDNLFLGVNIKNTTNTNIQASEKPTSIVVKFE